jgi:Ala-tRNA(Pro) deacylase
MAAGSIPTDYPEDTNPLVSGGTSHSVEAIVSMSATVQLALRDTGVEYQLVPHPHSRTSTEAAAAAHIAGDRLAKTVVLEDENGYLAAVLPSTHHVRLSRLWAQTGRRLMLAKESDIRDVFADCEVGAIPPTGTAYGMTTWLEEGLISEPDIYFEAGDHETLVHLSTGDFMRLMDRAEKRHFSHRTQSTR